MSDDGTDDDASDATVGADGAERSGAADDGADSSDTGTTPAADTTDSSGAETTPAGDGADPSDADTTAGSSLSTRLGTGGLLAGRLHLVVGLVVLAALTLRLVGLGGRVFHWDEGRVGYWILRFDATGEFFYRPIIHGPFLPVVGNALFEVLSPSDFTARLPVAVLGGLLPATALLLRDRLSDRETVAVALVLAVDPILVYYGRFMRSDVVVATFAFTAFALAVAAIDRRNGLYAVPAAAALALAFTAKENALVYVLCLVGAAVLLVDHRLVAVASRTGSAVDALVDAVVSGLRAAVAWTAGGRLRATVARRVDRDTTAAAVHLAVWVPVVTVASVATFVGVAAFFYAPRPELWRALGGAAPLAPVVEAATFGAAEKFVDSWVSAGEGNPYPAFVWDLVETLGYGSAVAVALGVVGFLADGYGGRNRPLVAFSTYWAAVSVLGYPVGTDIQAPWLAVHVVVPLAIPAGVGLVHLVDRLDGALAAEDGVAVGLAVVVLVAAGGGVAAANVDYWNASTQEDAAILQWAQPANEIQPTLERVQTVARHNEGHDVLYVGTSVPQRDDTRLWVANESRLDRAPPIAFWHSRLPMPWYLERVDANVTSTPPDARFDDLPADPPPVVVAFDWDREELATRLDGYTAYEHRYKLRNEELVIFVEDEALADARDASTAA
ncbi:flippase activity-associated protein Agl23 [Halobaculum sp. MBLA0147]|uniref:flippase activity-associated protein Agl23 n=1 Tax=Halobaculum sp. MBLA0147 TaxID=3079934 RepID=UPI0035268338